ncbi:MAG: paraquat-inducible protein A [Janthinobacterium lividum]
MTTDETIGCAGCGAVQRLPALATGSAAHCGVCATGLERAGSRNLDAALAAAATSFLLLLPANLLPVFQVSLLAATRESHLWSGAASLWSEGWPLLAVPVLLFAIVLPLLRFALLTVTLAVLRGAHRPRWLGPAFRWSGTLAIWAMPDVMLLGLWVAYGRLAALFTLQVEPGAYFLAAAVAAGVITGALVDRRAVWRAIMPARAVPPGPALSCPGCDLLLPLADGGGRCPRCAARLASRKPDGVVVTTALVVAGLIFYAPANLLPMAATIQVGAFLPYTVLKGVHDLIAAQLWGLAGLVFTASFVIPLLKLAAMFWLLWSVRARSATHLRAKTRLYGLVHAIGRWSMVDILAIASFVPLMQFDQLAGARALAGASAFVMVVLLTMAATETFDPRTIWDAARNRR